LCHYECCFVSRTTEAPPLVSAVKQQQLSLPHLSWYLLLELKETQWRQQKGELLWCACLQLKTRLKDILSYTPLMFHAKTPGASESSRIYASRGGIWNCQHLYNSVLGQRLSHMICKWMCCHSNKN
jgi:hypothetical protein